MVTVNLSSSCPSVDALIFAVPSGADLPPGVPFKELGFKAEAGSVAVVASAPETNSTLTVYVGTAAEPDAEAQRRAIATGIKAAGKNAKIAIDFSAIAEADLSAIAEGVVMSAYRFDTYKTPSAKNGKSDTSVKVTIITPDAKKTAATNAVKDAVAVAEAVNLARDWVNTPPADLQPAAFADSMEAKAADGVKVKVWDEKRLAKENCGGILGVGRGSQAPPRLVTLTWDPEDATTHIALVGKGITFDSGGLSIKPGASMMTMKCDMGGAAAVASAVNAIARLGLKIKVTGFACLAENMPSGSATRPGDVLTMRNGSTVEIHNTDAEGRLVLGDGLTLALEAEPDHIVDVATLTGAAMVALGSRTSAVLGNDEALEERVLAASHLAGESMWRLPIVEEMKAIVTSSSIADIKQHNPKPFGGTLFAAAFLREFVGEASWAHLDIAGPAFNDAGAYDYTPVGGTGAGVRTLVALARDLI